MWLQAYFKLMSPFCACRHQYFTHHRLMLLWIWAQHPQSSKER
jgi:hypothetical protein